MIDVIIPAYNCTKTLPRTLGSLVAQINKNFKVYVVDDCSTEDIKSVVDKFSDLLDIHYVRNEKNMRCGMTRQTGIDNSNSEYITFLDSDDVFMPYTIDVFYKNINNKPNENVFTSQFYVTTPDNEIQVYTNALTWCHGRLYKREFIEKFNIRNSPEVKYADDTYFNSMCDELNNSNILTINIPMMMWLYNTESITRKENGGYKEDCLSDFIHALRRSIEFVSNYKKIPEISFLKATLNNAAESYKKIYNNASLEERNRVDNELNLLSELLSEAIAPEDFKKLFAWENE